MLSMIMLRMLIILSVEDSSLPECEPDHDGVEAEEPSHGATEAGQRLARRSSICGVRVGVVGDDAGQQEQTRAQQRQQQLLKHDKT